MYFAIAMSARMTALVWLGVMSVAAAPFDLLGLKLGMVLDGDEMTPVFEEQLKPRIQSSGMSRWPYYRIDTQFKDGSHLETHFTGGPQRTIFAVIRTEQFFDRPAKARPMDAAIADAKKKYGEPDRVITFAGSPVRILLFGDKNATPKFDAHSVQMSKQQFDEFNDYDLRQQASVLGKDFRGVVLILRGMNGKAESVITELADFRAASNVFVK